MSRVRIAVVCAAVVLQSAASRPSIAADSGSYRFVDNWATFPEGMTAWSSATGVDIDAKGNIYVFHRNPAMPIMAFDKDGRFLRAWGQNMFIFCAPIARGTSGSPIAATTRSSSSAPTARC